LLLVLVAYYSRIFRIVRRSSRAKLSVVKQLGDAAALLPRTGPELFGFVAVSLTAGLWEEFLFRGYLIWALAPCLSWWGAAALSVVLFAFLHAYQGRQGAIRSAFAGVFFTVVVAVFGSLLPAIVLHAIADLGAGVIAWPALREPPAKDLQPAPLTQPAPPSVTT
jgi:membrane protease YdiL (CAAX protease family)